MESEKTLGKTDVFALKRSTIFTAQYSLVFIILLYFTYILSEMEIVRHLALVTAGNAMMIPIAAIIVVGIVASIVTLLNTRNEACLVEKMVANQEELDFGKSQLPSDGKFEKSLFVRHFRKFSTSEHNSWSEEAKSSLEGYLEDMIFQGPKILGHAEMILPLLGLMGTALGFSEAAFGKGNDASMFIGIGNAIGTTVLALYGNLFIYCLNSIVVAERNSLLKTVLVIFRIAQRR